MAIKISVANLRESPAPLLYTYPEQYQPQPAYVEMNERGEVTADYSGEIGDSTPMYVWHNRTLRMRVPSNVNGSLLAEFLEDQDTQRRLNIVHKGHDVEWDGSNFVGRLSAQAKAELERLEEELRDFDSVEVYSAREFFFGQNSLLDAWSHRTLADAVSAGKAAVIAFDGVVEGDVEEAFLKKAEDCLYGRHPEMLDAHHIAALLEAGRITQDEADEHARETREAVRGAAVSRDIANG